LLLEIKPDQTRLGLVKSVNIQEAKTHLSRLVEQVVGGEKVIIAKAGKPLAVLSAWQADTAPRAGGGWQGNVWVAEDFDAPSAEIEEMFGESAGGDSLRAAEEPGA
jgi:antitoxin (DNA-binding transcriptional repressor) of toxin-antitoxin stability system